MPVPIILTGGTGILRACARHPVAFLTIPKDLIAGFRKGCLLTAPASAGLPQLGPGSTEVVGHQVVLNAHLPRVYT